MQPGFLVMDITTIQIQGYTVSAADDKGCNKWQGWSGVPVTVRNMVGRVNWGKEHCSFDPWANLVSIVRGADISVLCSERGIVHGMFFVQNYLSKFDYVTHVWPRKIYSGGSGHGANGLYWQSPLYSCWQNLDHYLLTAGDVEGIGSFCY